ncbi:amino acid permease [uncultured Umboniibacter sp.]|uniref:APC family permease n=1 Tax=uncultured Umboniibacter sp. TaxID=1798917 RepID=UPI002605ADFE|nr:amino acid permease [uncultured Umboniibacter sp.]
MTKSVGVWRSWALVVGTMVGSGVFLLPAVLAPYGANSLWGWMFAGTGTLFIALSLASLASRYPKVGGPYAFTREAFGPFVGFLIAFGYWISLWSGVSAVAIAFAGYTDTLMGGNLGAVGQLAVALGIIAILCFVNCRGVESASVVQLVTTLLKLVPLVLVGFVGFSAGDWEAVEPLNPDNQSSVAMLSSMALLIMWAFIGVESATIPAEDTVNPQRTIPIALVVGTLTATAVYILATYGVQLLIPAEQLAVSTSPFTDAALILFGPIGAWLIGLGALVAIAGALNALILFSGQMTLALAKDGIFPKSFASLNQRGVPTTGLLTASVLAAVFVAMNYSDDLVSAFTWIIKLSTLMVILPYAVCALADLVLQRRNGTMKPLKVLVAVLALAYAIFAVVGSGAETVYLGALLLLAGMPLYFALKFGKQK